jgi:hypothetical protein
VLDVEAHAVAEGQHEQQRHRHGNEQAGDVPDDLKDFFADDGGEPMPAHVRS